MTSTHTTSGSTSTLLKRLLRCSALAVALTLAPASVFAAANTGELVEQLGRSAFSDRARAMSELVKQGIEAYDKVAEGLKHEKTEVRAGCARVLGAIGDSRAIDALLPLLASDAEVNVRIAAADALAKLAHKDEARTSAIFSALMPAADATLDANELLTRMRAAASLKLGASDAQKLLAALEPSLTPEGSPALGLLAIDKLAEAKNADAIVAFLKQAKTPAEGETPSESFVWAYAGEGWFGVRYAALLHLMVLGHADAGTMFVEDIQLRAKETAQQPMSQNQVLLAREAQRLGVALVPALITALKDNTSGNLRTELRRLLSLTGRVGLEANVQEMRKAIEELRVKRETEPTATNSWQNEFEGILNQFLEHREGRQVTLEVLRDILDQPEVEGEFNVSARIMDRLIATSKIGGSGNEGLLRDVVMLAIRRGSAAIVKQALTEWPKLARGEDLAIISERLVKHDDVSVREALATALSQGGIAAYRSRPVLEELAKDASVSVRTLVWDGLSLGEDPSVLEVFYEGMKDSEPDVQFEAALNFGKSLSTLRWDNKGLLDNDRADKRREIGAKAIEIAKRADAAAAGVFQSAQTFQSYIFNNESALREEFAAEVAKHIASADLRLRRSALRVNNQTFGDSAKDHAKKLVERFVVEDDAGCAYYIMTFLTNQVSALTPEEVEKTIDGCIKWSNVQHGTGGKNENFLNVGDTAGRLLGQCGKKEAGKRYDYAVKAIRERLTTAMANRMTDTTMDYAVAYCVRALNDMDAISECSFVIDTVTPLFAGGNKPSFLLNNNILTYLKKAASKTDLERIKAMGLPEGDYQSIVDQVNKRQ